MNFKKKILNKEVKNSLIENMDSDDKHLFLLEQFNNNNKKKRKIKNKKNGITNICNKKESNKFILSEKNNFPKIYDKKFEDLKIIKNIKKIKNNDKNNSYYKNKLNKKYTNNNKRYSNISFINYSKKIIINETNKFEKPENYKFNNKWRKKMEGLKFISNIKNLHEFLNSIKLN